MISNESVAMGYSTQKPLKKNFDSEKDAKGAWP